MEKGMESSLLVLFILYPTFAMNAHCRNHTFDKPTNSEVLHFSKENSDREFGIYDKFKCLHCCSHGYRSIEWFKNGQAYPWPTDVSTLIIHPESGNQTICSQQSTTADSGKYWCIARNDTHFLRHEVLLQISDLIEDVVVPHLVRPRVHFGMMNDFLMTVGETGPSISMGWPKTTYRPRDQKAEHGDSVRFYCEAFVGTIDLPDFQSEITWERSDVNESFIKGERVFQEDVFREEKRILGSYLYIKQVTSQDYGEYTCKVRNLGDQVVRLSAWLNGNASISSICLFRFGFVRASRSPYASARVDDSRKDVLVTYHKNDEQKALKAISTLQGRLCCSYSLLPLQLKPQLGDEDLKAMTNSYRAVRHFSVLWWMEFGLAKAFICSFRGC